MKVVVTGGGAVGRHLAQDLTDQVGGGRVGIHRQCEIAFIGVPLRRVAGAVLIGAGVVGRVVRVEQVADVENVGTQLQTVALATDVGRADADSRDVMKERIEAFFDSAQSALGHGHRVRHEGH